MDVDEALDKVGGYRRWHLSILVYLCCSLCIPLCYQDLNIVFLGWQPPHHCKVPDNSTFNETIPFSYKDGEMVYDSCNIYTNFSHSNETQACSEWTYTTDGYTSIVTQWDLVCSNNYLSEISQVIYQAFSLLGDITMSFLIDRFGRRPIHTVACVLVSISGTAVAFSTNYIMFVIMRSITGFCVTAVYISAFTMVMETFDSKRRARVGIGVEFPWVAVYLFLPLWAWLIHNWRYLQLFVSVMSAFWILDLLVLPESVPWLVVTGRYEQAEKVLKKMAKWNGKDVGDIKLKREAEVAMADVSDEKAALTSSCPDLTEPKVKDATTSSAEKASLADNVSIASHVSTNSTRDITISDALMLFKDPILRVHTVISSLLWFVDWVVYFCLILVSPSLAGNRFINFLIMGLVEIPAYILTLFIVDRYGRRIPTCIFHIATAVPLLIVVFLPAKTASGVDLSLLATTLFMISKFSITGAFAIIVLYTKELFPTNLRATSTGAMNFLGRIGNMLAPMTAYAAKTDVPWLPSVIMAFLCIGIGILVLRLPETNGMPLPQTLVDIHTLYGKKPSKKAKDAENGKPGKGSPIYKQAPQTTA